MLFFRNEGFVRCGIQQTVQLCRILQCQLDQPRAVRVFVDRFRSRRQVFVDGAHRTGCGRVDLTDGLHAFHRTKGRLLRQVRANLRQVNKDNVSQQFLRVRGNANGGLGAVGVNLLMFLGVAVVCRIAHALILKRSLHSARAHPKGAANYVTARMRRC